MDVGKIDENSVTKNHTVKRPADDAGYVGNKRYRPILQRPPEVHADAFMAAVCRNKKLLIESSGTIEQSMPELPVSRTEMFKQLVARNREKLNHDPITYLRTTGLLDIIEEGIEHVLDQRPSDPKCVYLEFIRSRINASFV